MASVYKQPDRSKFWLARFRMPDGKWVSRTTKLTDRAAAQCLAFEWEGVASSPCELSPTGTAIARVTLEIFERASRTKVEMVSIGDFLRHWVSRIEGTKSAGTANRYRQAVEAFLSHLGPSVERRNISTLTPSLLQGFIDEESSGQRGAHIWVRNFQSFTGCWYNSRALARS